MSSPYNGGNSPEALQHADTGPQKLAGVFCLGDIADLDAPPFRRWRRVTRNRVLQPDIKVTGFYPRIPVHINTGHGGHQPLDAPPRQSRQADDRDARCLRQEPVHHLPQRPEGCVAILDLVPLVGHENDGPAFPQCEIGNLKILLFKRRFGIKHHQHNFRKTDGTQTVCNRELLQLFLNLRPFTHPGRIEQLHRPDTLRSLPLPFNADRVAGNPGFRAGQDPVILEQMIDER